MSKYLCLHLCLLAVSALICSGLPTTLDEGQKKALPEVGATPAIADAPTPEVAAELPSSAPKITYSKETKVKPGDSVAVDCEVKNVDLTGLPGFKILWGKVEEADDGTEKVFPISSNEKIELLSDKYTVVHPVGTYRYSLKIDNVNEKDSGLYRCTVVFGESQTIDADVPIIILKPAYFSDQSTKTIRVAEGDAISIDCQPGGSPKPEVYWERLGEELPFYGGQFFKANQFELPLVDRTHVGHYVCYADNGLAVPATSEVIIEVEYKPSVAVKEDRISAAPYEEVQMECFSEGIPEPRVQWKKAGEIIQPSANIIIDTKMDADTRNVVSKLKILQVQVEEFSDYSCVSDNSVGESEVTVRVAMKTPPSIEKQTKGEKIYELQEDVRGRDQLPIALECIGSGVPTPTYRWTKDGELLLWQTDPRMSLELGTGTLLIRNPAIKDNGDYQCFAYNDLGMAASDKIALKNSTMIDFIREEPGDVSYDAEVGRPFRFACPKVVGHPKPELTWMKARQRDGGVEMQYIDNDRMTIDEMGTLWISHILEEDDTEKNNFKYTCLATSELHPQDISLAKTITLRVIPPSDKLDNLGDEQINIETFLMHSTPSTIKLKTYQENRLWCIFGGEPLPQVIWKRADGRPIDTDRYLVENQGQTLVLRNTQIDDAGEYECLASNGVGNNKKLTINVLVEVVPKFVHDFKSQSQVVHDGTTVTFSCAILGEPVAQPTYEWFFNSRPLTFVEGSRRNTEGSSLIIFSATSADIGNYACKASNEVGYTYGQTTLSVIPKPPSSLASAIGNDKVLKDINEKIESLSTAVLSLREIVEAQVKGNKANEGLATLLQQIADKVLYKEPIPRS